MELNTKDLKIIKSALNCLISQRHTYGLVVTSENKQNDNKKKLQEEYELLDRVLKELNNE